MTQEQIQQLETELWDAADQLRASSKLTAAEYKDPVLGLVLLRFAQNRYEEAARRVDLTALRVGRHRRDVHGKLHRVNGVQDVIIALNNRGRLDQQLDLLGSMRRQKGGRKS